MKQWYTLHTKPNSEYQVVTALQQRQLQVYLPEIKVSKAGASCQRKPFFPCYLFAKVDFELVSLSQMQWTPGLRRIVTFDERPVPLPNEVIELLRNNLSRIDRNNGRPTPSFKQGDPVRITEGPFRDMLAIFDGPSTPAQRVQVLLQILGASKV